MNIILILLYFNPFAMQRFTEKFKAPKVQKEKSCFNGKVPFTYLNNFIKIEIYGSKI